jgi:hypothetical protein
MKSIARASARKRQRRVRTTKASKPRRTRGAALPFTLSRGGFASSLRSRARLSLSDFANADDVLTEPKPEFLVQDLLFPGAPFSLFGLPGVGKSLIALLLAVCIAARRPFLNRAVNLAHPRSVVYVAAEGKRFVGPRLRAICEAYGLAQADLKYLHVLRRPIGLTDAAAVQDFIEAVRALLINRPEPALILFDTLTKCLGRAGADENSPRDMALLADGIDTIIEATGAAVGFVDHTGWKGEHERGHSNKRGNVETAMLITRGTNGVVKLESEKANHAEAFTPICLRIEKRADAAVAVVPPAVHMDLTPSGMAQARRSALNENGRKALAALANEPNGLAFTRWKDTSELAQSTLDRCRQWLLRQGFVEAIGPDTKPRYVLTAEGERCLSEAAA